MSERRLPPITELGMVAMGLIAAGVIYLSAHLPEPVSTTPAVILVAAAALVIAVAFGLLARTEGFAWDRFLYIAARALIAYAIISGLIIFVFLHNDTSGGPLAVLIAALVLFALDVPLLIGFTVARYAN